MFIITQDCTENQTIKVPNFRRKLFHLICLYHVSLSTITVMKKAHDESFFAMAMVAHADAAYGRSLTQPNMREKPSCLLANEWLQENNGK